MSGRLKLGQILVSKGLIDPDQLAAALGEQEKSGARLGMTLVRLGYLEEEVLIRALASQLRVPVARVAGKTIRDEVLELVPAELAEKHRCLPLFARREQEGPVLLLAMEDPSDKEALEEIAARAGQRVRAVLVGPSELEDALRRHYHVDAPMPEPADALPPASPPAAEAPAAERDDEESPPLRGLDPALDTPSGDFDLELPLDGSAEAAREGAPDTRPEGIFDDFDSLRETDPEGSEPFEPAASSDSRGGGRESGDAASLGAGLEIGGGASFDDDLGTSLDGRLDRGPDAGLDGGLDLGASLDGRLESGPGASLDGRLESGPGASLGAGFESGPGASLGAGLESGPGASLDGGFGDSLGTSLDGSLGSTLDGALVVPVERPSQPVPSRAPARGGLEPQLILRALSQLLVEKGVITRDELAERLRRVASEADGA
jgi:hypothetical protein